MCLYILYVVMQLALLVLSVGSHALRFIVLVDVG